MCQKHSSTQRISAPSPMAIKLAKISVVFIFFYFAECAAGSCLSYGHSCWGAHGKRTDPNNVAAAKGEVPSNDPLTDTRWFLSRLYQDPSELPAQWKARDGALLGPNRQMLRENEIAEGLKSTQEDEPSDYQDPFDNISNDIARIRNWQQRERLYNILKSRKLN